jgi:hypothetical protein
MRHSIRKCLVDDTAHEFDKLVDMLALIHAQIGAAHDKPKHGEVVHRMTEDRDILQSDKKGFACVVANSQQIFTSGQAYLRQRWLEEASRPIYPV